MTVNDLIQELQKVEDKDLDVRMVNPWDDADDDNLWVGSIEVSSQGQSGYEMFGEVRLIAE